jgi:hypothetical protein
MAPKDMSYSKFGHRAYSELKNPATTPLEAWAKVEEDVNVSFADDNKRYPKEQVPVAASELWKAKGWKGEKIHTQILIWTKIPLDEVTFQTEALDDGKGNIIDSKNIQAAFVRYVMTDEFGEGCDKRTPSKYDSSLVEDPIDIVDRLSVAVNTVQPVWLSVKIPADIPAGDYSGSVIVNANGYHVLKVSLTVSDHLLPPSSEWQYDLDLWQNPDPIAKVHGVKSWSDEHYKLMEPYFRMLADAGQKNITAFIIDQPWGPDHVYYRDPTLIRWSKRKDGSWSYDYSVFDRYIEFMMNCGIDRRINCYSMVTWNLSFIYFDESKGDTVSVYAKPGSAEYNDLWEPMIRNFTAHLKSKGWFEKTAIAMDERDMESMMAVMALLKRIEPEWKTALAGGYHREIAMDIFDYCIIIHGKFDPDILEARKAKNMPSTFYTACGERKPNGFTFSSPAENAWISWYAFANGYTGYLRWAYNDWTRSTLEDTRYKTWPAGDCYQVYPGPRTSIRFEKLIEGIQDYEKLRIVKEQLTRDGSSDELNELQQILSEFTVANLESTPAEAMVAGGRRFLDRF